MIVVDDGSTDTTPGVIARSACARCARTRRQGPNPARNAAAAAAGADLIALVDDDVHVPPHWLRAMVAGAERHPDADALGGPIRARFDGPAPRSCGREDPPITALDLGPVDRARGARLEREPDLPPPRVRPGRPVPGRHPARRRRGGVAAAPGRRGRQGRLRGRRLARAPPRGRRRAPALAHAQRLLPRAQRALLRHAPGRRAAAGARAARAGGLRLAHRAPRLPAGADHGRALRGAACARRCAPR